MGGQDVRTGEIVGCPFYIGAAQFEYRRHTQLIIDVVPGRGGELFSLDNGQSNGSSRARRFARCQRRHNVNAKNNAIAVAKPEHDCR